MSILKRFLGDSPTSRIGGGQPGSTTPAPADVDRALSGQPPPPAASNRPRFGMKVVLLNWKMGENDPFSVVNRALAGHFHACGKNVEVIEISDQDWPARLEELVVDGVEFAVTWQGLGSRVKVGEDTSLWDYFKVPLICLHGDHPSHMPPNHALESRYCFHLYAQADAARYSNRHFRRAFPARVIDIPQLHREPPRAKREGDWFVVAKNIDDPVEFEKKWRQGLPPAMFETYMAATEAIKAQLAVRRYVELHDTLDDHIRREALAALDPSKHADAYHRFHSEIDMYVRSHKAVAMLASIRDVPVHVYGRGWERFANEAPPNHHFAPGKSMANSQELYYSRFGLIDVSPSKGLHDRTRRAMANGTGFLSSASLDDHFADVERFSSVFFDFQPGSLAGKCASVMKDPRAHEQLASEFAHRYHNRFHFREFVSRLEALAGTARHADATVTA